jgi:hypothetical protein
MTRRQILTAIGCEHLTLHQGPGYWYFTYDDQATNRFDTRSVYTMRLHDLTLAEWIAEGRALVDQVQGTQGKA